MATQLIEFPDGSLVEVEIGGEQVREVSGRFATRVNATFENIRPLLVQACRPVISVFQELNQEAEISEAEVELGLSFDVTGSIYLAQCTARSNITVKLLLKPKHAPTPDV